ncbi:MAG: homocysteine S-methyltransferase family protein [Endomicrobium sp.]|jgi:5-methyltetrahydrofolate--homocysteine methyltransferase|nr:homocysteine S-methyltransferase family protein [Endomicrobium sp.]
MNKTDFLNILKEKVLIMDGAYGTELQKRKYLDDVNMAEELNIKYPDRISNIYADYINAGADIILTNTFSANSIKLKQYGLINKANDIIGNSIDLIKKISKNVIIAGDMSSVGEYIEPLGPLCFDEVYEAFAFQVKILKKYGIDILVIETMTEIKETKAAILAAKDNFKGAIIVQMTFSKDGVTSTGTSLNSFIALCEGLGVDVVGLNCSIGSKDLSRLIKILSKDTYLPISFKPNAGVPILINKTTYFPETCKTFLNSCLKAYSYGANIFGGCCGTNPKFIKTVANMLKNKLPKKRLANEKYFLSSRINAIDINKINRPIMIGERINPTNRKELQKELMKENFVSVKDEARSQVASNVTLLDINMGVPGIDEVKLLKNAIIQIQEIVNVPFCIDSSNVEALNEAIKNYAGIPIINSVNGEQNKLETIIPIAKRYGTKLIALTTDQFGIPDTAEKRLNIAKRIIGFAKKFDFEIENIIFDYLVLAVSSSQKQIRETLRAMEMSKTIYPKCKLVLGISNVSYGLPNRQILNSTFLKMAIKSGLDFAIVNPHMNWNTYNKLAENLFKNGTAVDMDNYISNFSAFKKCTKKCEDKKLPINKQLYLAILNGSYENIKEIVGEIIKFEINPFKLVNEVVLSALEVVGKKFSSKEFFLPQIILSAKAAQIAFSTVKASLKRKCSSDSKKIIMATVMGDIHDIGKNIVIAVLESYGFEVIDLGINVDAKTIINKAKEINPIVIGLSALMTTTMPEMETVVKLRNSMKLSAKIIIGGAAVTKEFANDIGADGYACDAMEAALYVKKLF